MTESRLVIVCGMSGAGKSTVSQELARQYGLNGIDHVWLHEEVDCHPIREGEFSAGSRATEEGMDANVLQMYSRWETLAEQIARSDSVYILEGCLYQNIIRYFFGCNYPVEKITRFYDHIAEITAKLNPTIVLLYKEDVRRCLADAFAVRGERWRNLILGRDWAYFESHEYTGDESIYAMWEDYQQLADAMFERYRGNKMKICTSGGEWVTYMKRLTRCLGLGYHAEEVRPVLSCEPYVGRYGTKIDGRLAVLEIKERAGELYCEVSWWSNMKLKPLGNHVFDVQSFPITLTFDLYGSKRSLLVTGTYGWGLTGKTLVEI